MPRDRFERDIEFREPAIRRTAQAFATVAGLWAIRDKRRGEIHGYCVSEIHANTVAAHAQHFEVEYVTGPFELPFGPAPGMNDVLPEGRFRRIVEEEG